MLPDIEFNEQEAMLLVVLTGMRPPLLGTAVLYQAGDLAGGAADRIDSELSPLVGGLAGQVLAGVRSAASADGVDRELSPLVEELAGQVLSGMSSAVSPELGRVLAQYTAGAPGYFP